MSVTALLRFALVVQFAWAPACSGGPPSRTVVLSGVTVTTSIPHSLAVIADSIDAGGARRQTCYAMLGQRAGHLTFGERMPDGTRIRLQLGVGADIWYAGSSAGEAKLVESRSLPGLSGATVGNRALELRGASASHELHVEPGAALAVALEGGRIVARSIR